MLNGRRVVLIGERSVLPGTGTVEGLQKHGFQVAERYTLAVTAAPDITRRRAIVALMTELFDFVRTEPVDEVIIVAQGFDMRLIDELMLRLRDLPLPVRLLPAPELQRLLDQPLTDVGFAHAVELQRAPLAVGERAAKRILDVSLASIGLIALTPLLMGVALAIKLESRGPVFFRQQRVGQTGRPFRIFKFRSMKVMDDGAVVKQATRDDARITRVGRWLRATSIDELPQLLNVINGEMSLVGPRPHALAHDNEYTRLIANYALRHHVKPAAWNSISGISRTGISGSTSRSCS
jgi:lipopolysaccharide/colanic/teichoic acid biosynthesis glycosyltransferase